MSISLLGFFANTNAKPGVESVSFPSADLYFFRSRVMKRIQGQCHLIKAIPINTDPFLSGEQMEPEPFISFEELGL